MQGYITVCELIGHISDLSGHDAGVVSAVEQSVTAVLSQQHGVFLFPELLAYFCDDVGKRREGGGIDEHTLDAVQTLLRLLTDKDLFRAYYRRQMARRVLAGRYDIDIERALLRRLRAECGFAYTAKMDGILADVASSSALFASFVRAASDGPADAVPVGELFVLNSQHWPVVRCDADAIQLPPPLSCTVDAFESCATYGFALVN